MPQPALCEKITVIARFADRQMRQAIFRLYQFVDPLTRRCAARERDDIMLLCAASCEG